MYSTLKSKAGFTSIMGKKGHAFPQRPEQADLTSPACHIAIVAENGGSSQSFQFKFF
jgi:hypothetical protein